MERLTAREEVGQVTAEIRMADTHLETVWQEIEPSLHIILGDEKNSSLDVMMYTNTYTKAYNYCTTSSVHRTRNNDTNSSVSLVGSGLYEKVKEFLRLYLISGKKNVNETFLQYYIRTWQRFLIGSRRLSDVLDYLNRYWVGKERNSGHRDIYDIFSLCLLSWRDYKFQPNLTTLMNEIMEQIELKRQNIITPVKNLNVAIESFVLLGFDANDLKKQNLSVYINDFEKRFLLDTYDFYLLESKNYIEQNGVVNYIKRALEIIDDENKNLADLNDHTRKPLNENLNKVLIEDHQVEIRDQLSQLLDNERYDDLKKINILLNRVPFTLKPLLENFQNYIITQGKEEIKNFKIISDENHKNTLDKYNEEIKNSNSSKLKIKPKRIQDIDPNQYIKVLLKVYNKYKDIILKSFDNDQIFIKVLETATQNFINNNIIATPTPRSKSKTPEYLAKYCDDYIKDKHDDMNLDEIIKIFNFIEDKDGFEVWYRRCLSKRLFGNLSIDNEEKEETIIQKLKVVNNVEYTNRITNMFNDIRSSQKLGSSYKDLVEKQNNLKDYVVDLDPKVLDSAAWDSIIKRSNDSFSLPKDLVFTEELFTKLYKDKQNGRKLNWIWNRSKIELKANLSKPGKPPFVFTVTLYQYAILLGFQEEDELTTFELLNITGLSQEIFRAHMIPFIKNKLITQTPSGDKYLLESKTVFKICKEYKSKKLRVNFSNVKVTDSQIEEKEANEEIEAHHRELLNAAIVRIMKARKTIGHESLCTEVYQILNSRFKPQMIDIKKSIENLIEEGYIERNKTRDGYNYLS